ncbi:SDR family oxidoreductase [Alphaproteobacteria bacterium]|nr:SDR family oxidoreductase [Alphaproteobacteria bacterium]
MNDFVNHLFGLEGRVAAVTGGGGYLCGEMSRGLAKAGCDVAVIDLRQEKADAVAEEITAEYGKKAIGIGVDAANKAGMEAALTRITAELGPVDIMINGAGINAPTPFFDIELDEFHAVMDSQITSTLIGCQVFGAHMVANGKGSIINISSASAGPPLSKAFAYSAAKAAIKNLTQNLGREWATKGVRVNAIRPGFFPTEWNRKNFITPEREAAILGHTPMDRYGEVDELVGGIIYLASDASTFVTGSELAVDGGFSAMTV